MTANFPRVANRRRTRSILIASVIGVAITALLLLLTVRFASDRPDEVNLGDKRFVVGRADRFAERIASQGSPILFKDPLTSKPGRELFVQHLGDDVTEGWSAIGAYAPGTSDLDCLLEWVRTDEEFRDPCTGTTYPADGAGLTTYPGEVDERTAVVIDLRTSPESSSSN